MFKHVASGLSVIASLAVAGMMLVTLADVTSRNIRDVPIRGTFDLVELLLVICIFFGLPDVFYRRRNIAVDVIDHFVGPSAGRWLAMLATMVVGLFLLLLFYAMVQPSLDTVRFPEHKQETGIPTWVYWIPILFGGMLSLVGAIFSVRLEPSAGEGQD